MADSANLRELEENDGDSVLAGSIRPVQPYQFEPRRESAPDYSEDSESDTSSESDLEGQLSDRLGNTDWCECGFCIPMPSVDESTCCREIGLIDNLVEDQDLQCITQHPGYEGNCLNQYVIETSFYEFLDNYGHVGDDEPIHEMYRHVAYRRFTRWVWHRLGRGMRKVIPACAVNKIRQSWPSEQYCGFKYQRDY